MAVILLSAFIVQWYSQGHRRTATAQRPHTGTLGRLAKRRGGGSVDLQPAGGELRKTMTAERISAGAYREKRGSRTGRNRTTGKDRGEQLTSGLEQDGHTNGIRSDLADWRTLPEEAREKNISRRTGEQERTAPAHHRQTRHPAFPCA